MKINEVVIAVVPLNYDKKILVLLLLKIILNTLYAVSMTVREQGICFNANTWSIKIVWSA